MTIFQNHGRVQGREQGRQTKKGHRSLDQASRTPEREKKCGGQPLCPGTVLFARGIAGDHRFTTSKVVDVSNPVNACSAVTR